MPSPGTSSEELEECVDNMEQEARGTTAVAGDERREWTEAEWAEWNKKWYWGQSWMSGSQWYASGEAGQRDGAAGAAASTTLPASGVERSDPWHARNGDPWSRRTSTSGAPPAVDHGRQGGWWQSGHYAKGDYSDPPAWPGWSNYRLWRRAILRWNHNTDVSVWRRAEKVLKTLEWDLQAKLDHVSETTLASPAYITEILGVLDVLAGEREDSEKRRAVRAALFEGNRRGDESLAQYALRRESQFEVASRYIAIPEEIKGILLEEQSGLSKQSMQSLRVLTKGQHSYSELRKALQVLDLDEESIVKPGKVNYFGDTMEEEIMDSDLDDEEVFAALEYQEVDEDAAISLMADLQQDRRRTWKENKLLKAARRKDRRHFDDKNSRPSRPPYRRRLSIEELKKVTHCSNCGKKGHWREDCHEASTNGDKTHKDKRPKMAAFAYLGVSEQGNDSVFLVANFGSYQTMEQDCFLELGPGQAIVDPGASQDLIGHPSFLKLQEKLREVGLKTIKLEEKPAKASGVGGTAKTLFMALAPCILGGQPGIVKLTVVEDNIPQLLSIGLLEHGHAVIDTQADQIFFKKFDKVAKMTRIPSGHRILSIADWDGSEFPVPPQLTEKFGLTSGAFNVRPSAPEVYMAASAILSDRASFFGQVGVCEEMLDSFEISCSLPLSNFPFFSDFETQSNDVFFRASWLVNGCETCLLERNAKRERPQTCTYRRDAFELTECPLSFDQQHWSESLIVSLFTRHEVVLTRSDEQVVLFNDDRSVAASKEIEDLLRDRTSRAQYSSCDLQHGGRAQCQGEEVAHSLGSGPRTPGDELASLCSKAADLESGPGSFGDSRHEDAPRGLHDVVSGTLRSVRDDAVLSEDVGQLQSSQRVRDSRRQSAWNVDKVLTVPEQDWLPKVRQEQPASGGQKGQERGSRDLCLGTIHASSENSSPGDLRPRALHHAGSRDGVSGSESAAGTQHGCHHGPGDDTGGGGLSPSTPSSGRGGPADPRSTRSANATALLDSAAHHAANRSDSSTRSGLSGVESGGDPPDDGTVICHGTATSSSRGGRTGQPSGGASGPHGLELRERAATGFTSSSVVGDFKCTEDPSHTWLVIPCSATSSKFLSRRENIDCFVGKQKFRGGFRDVFIVRDSELVDDLVCSDFPEGAETHLSRKQKKALLNSLDVFSTEFVGGPMSPSEMVGLKQVDHQKKEQEPESHQEKHQEPRDHQERHQEPESLQEEKRSRSFDLISRPRRSKRSIEPSSQELSALGIVDVQPSSHGMGASNVMKVMEIFTPPRVATEAVKAGLAVTEPSSLDLTTGWDALKPEDRKRMWEILEHQKPDIVIMSPDCKMFCQLMNVNLSRVPVERLSRDQMRALVMWHMCIQVAEHQLNHDRYFFLEQPGGASSWKTHAAEWLLKQKGVHHFLFDQCELGLQVSDAGLSRKTTGAATNHLGIAFLLSQYQCSGSHQHIQLENGLPHKARIYPPDLVHNIVQGILWGSQEFVGAAQPDDLIDEEGEEGLDLDPQPRTPGTLQRDQSEVLSEEQKKKVMLMHLNMGHLPRDKMLTMLKAAGAREGVLCYVKNTFSCGHCMRQQKPVERRHAAVPRTFSFNRIIGLDYFFLSFMNKTFAFLNAVCHGTNFQQVGLLKEYDGGVPSS